MRKYLFYILSVILIALTFFKVGGISYAVDEDISLSQLQIYLQDLENTKETINLQSKKQAEKYGNLATFIKTNLTQNEITDFIYGISYFSQQMHITKVQIDEKKKDAIDTTSEEQLLLLIQGYMYSFISWYVDTEKMDTYLEYVQLIIFSEAHSQSVMKEIQKTQSLLNKKLSYFQEKIDIYSNELQGKLDITISNKITERLTDIDNNPKYKYLPKPLKNQIYRDIVVQLSIDKKNIQNSQLSESYKKIKIAIIDKIIEEIQKKISL